MVNGIGNKIVENLLDFIFIHRQDKAIAWRDKSEGDFSLFGDDVLQGEAPLHRPEDVHLAKVQGETAGFNEGNIKKIIDEMAHEIGGCKDRPQKPEMLMTQATTRLIKEEFRK